MPNVSPVTITINTTSIELVPAGGNGNGSMSYRSADNHQNLVIVPKPGNGKTEPDRATMRLNLRFDVQDHLDATKTVEREAFARVDFTLPASRDVDTGHVIEALIAALGSTQVAGVLNGETFW